MWGLANATRNVDIRRAGAGADECGDEIFAVEIIYSIFLTTVAKIVTARDFTIKIIWFFLLFDRTFFY